MDNITPGPLPWSASDWSEATMGESLRLAAESLCAFGGFGAVSIDVVRDDQLVTIAVAGAERVLDVDGETIEAADILGSSFPVEPVESTLLPRADDWGLLRYIPHDRVGLPGFGWRVDTTYVDAEWHPDDLLIVPVRDERGRLRGLLSMDAPTHGLLPRPERRAVLERYAAQASRILLTALEREELAERQRLAMAARHVLGRAADGDSPEAVLADVAADLIAAFELAGLRAVVFEGATRRILVEVPAALGEFDAEILRISRSATEWLWQRQLVGLVGRDQATPYDGPAEDVEQARELIRSRGLESLVLVPLGAGDTCLGGMVFFRAEGGARWTDAECEAAQEIGRDLGRLLSVQRALRLEREAVEELRALDDYKTGLIATVAHELKNPIAAIRSNLELTAEIVDEPDAKPSLEAVGRGVDRISRIVEDLLLLAAANDPHLPAPGRSTDLTRPVVAGVQQAVESTGRPAADVSTELPGSPVVLRADPHGIEQVVVNLVDNALKYTPLGRSISVALRDRGDHVELTVADEGIGISADDQQRIFTEFFRSADPAARRQPGTGLGLAIVERIVAHHGGRIEVESTLGRGSTFRVVLPRP